MYALEEFYLATVTMSCAVVLFVVILRVNWRRLTSRGGVSGLSVLGLVFLVYGVSPMAWLVALCEPLNSARDPVVLGLGGNLYGLDYEYYLETVFVFLVVLYFPLVVVFAMPPRFDPSIRRRVDHLLLGRSEMVSRVEVLLSFYVIFVVVLYFSSYGWDKMGVSDTSRWESNLEDRFGLFGRFKFLLFGVIVSGVFLAVSGVMTKNFMRNRSLVLVSLMPFLALSSRGFTVIFSVWLIGEWIRFKGKLRWLFAGPAVLLLVVSYLLPLTTRSHNESGVVYALTQIDEIDSYFGMKYPPQHMLTRVMTNFGLGFPVLSDSIMKNDIGHSMFSNIPVGYRVRMFSPFPSVIDGFSENYLIYKPKVNFYTPESAVSELVGLYGYKGVALFLVLIGVLLALGRFVELTPFFGAHLVFVFSALFLVFVVKASAYEVRTSTRFFYAAIYLLFPLSLLLRMSGSRVGWSDRFTR